MKNSNAFDAYELNSKIIKSVADILADPLAILINNCFSSGTFPSTMKYSVVLPVLKKGSTDDINNFRPISIIPILGKIIEIILKQQLYNFLESNSLLCPGQFGFRKNRSTTQALLKVVSDIVEGLEKGKHSQLSLCDLSKAFDCVSHVILLQKMYFYGIRGLALDFFESYLGGRTQCVRLGGDLSNRKNISHGVPQGSVLGPLLFLIYINDLYYCTSPIKSVFFADDTTFVSQSTNLENVSTLAVDILNVAQVWFTSNKLKINIEKNQSLIVSSKTNIPQEIASNYLACNLMIDSTGLLI
ncbi:hypothetical protein JTB14_036987 [Gonioctena quinquepunctata]|nr:hypothetical protein JTB14_036987 [Gonioctena quinquepunctata]